MRPKVFAAQPIPQVALDILRQAADVSVYPYMDRQISVDELVGGAIRAHIGFYTVPMRMNRLLY
jgi:hypothetical protein